MDLFNELKKRCIEEKIPIIRDDLVDFFKKFILEKNIKSILEIGTAYGYSALLFYNINKNLKITTIEKNLDNFKIAKEFLPKDITLINGNAFEYIPDSHYDLIFIDGPKSKQEILVNKYKDYLSLNGFIIIDNIFLKDLKLKPQNKQRQKLIIKNEKFVQWIKHDCELNWKILDIGDGIALLWKKQN